MKMTSKRCLPILVGLMWFHLGCISAESGKVDLLITRAPDRGLVTESELKGLDLSEVTTERALNRLANFCEAHPQPLPGQVDDFHRHLYDFLVEQEGGRTFDLFSVDFALALGHDSNIAKLPADEWRPSNQSSAHYDWGLGLDWNGRPSPWGQWTFGVDFSGRDNDRKTVSGYDYSLVAGEVKVQYESGWHWSLANDWYMYSPSGSGHVGDIRWDYLVGYQGHCSSWWSEPMEWKADLILQRDDFRQGTYFAGQDRYRYGLQGQWLWQNECGMGRWDSFVRHAWIVSNGSVDSLDYVAVQSEFQTKVDLDRSVCNLIVDLKNEKRLRSRRSGAKSNDSLWSWTFRVERPLWSQSAMGYVSVGINDVDSRLETMTFHSEDVALGMEWAW